MTSVLSGLVYRLTL